MITGTKEKTYDPDILWRISELARVADWLQVPITNFLPASAPVAGAA